MKLYFFGDSISFGQYISVENVWVTRIGMLIKKKYPNMELLIQNLSVNGNTTRMALERMPYDIQSHDIDILVIGFGMNDCNYWESDKGLPRVSPQAFEANMKEIIDRAYNFNIREVIIHTNHPSPRTDLMSNTNITYGQSNHFYNEIIRKIARDDKRVNFVDIEREIEEIGGCEHFVLKDGVHLSMAGHELYYKLFGNCIVNIIEGKKKLL